MNRGRITSVAVAATAAAIMGLTLTGATPASASASARHTVVLNCLSKPQVKPRDLVLACADGNSALSRLSWTSWTPAMASATGTLVQNDCVPYCAAGHFHNYPALAVLWGPVAIAHGQRFSEITVIFPGARPPVFNGHKWVTGPQTITSRLY